MKMLNRIEASKTPRWDMMMVVKKTQVELDQLYTDLQKIGHADELAALISSISSLNHLMLKLDTRRVGEIENA